MHKIHMMRSMALSYLVLLPLLVNPVWAAMYKCTNSNGQVSYQQKPCPDATPSSSEINIKSTQPQKNTSVSDKPFDFRKAQSEYDAGNTREAIRALKNAAMKGNINAQMTLANIYCYSPGRKIPVNNAEAAKWSKMACDNAGVTSSCGVYKKATKGQCKQVEDKRKKYKWLLK